MWLLMQEYKLMEVRLSSLAHVELAVISRLKCEQLAVSRRSVCAQSGVDPRVSVTFDQQAFHSKKPISFTAQVTTISIIVVINARNPLDAFLRNLRVDGEVAN